MVRVEKVHSDSNKSDPKPEISNSVLQLLCLVGNSFPFFIICSPVGFISIRHFKFKIEIMIKETSYFFPCVKFFNLRCLVMLITLDRIRYMYLLR